MSNKHIHFVGIGGIGMSALAQLFLSQGHTVSGSDRDASQVTDLLEEKGATVHIGHTASCVPEQVTQIIYSDAVPDDNPERAVARERGVETQSYFEALGEATKTGTSIVIAGTHGKTTTTAMVAKVLIDAGKEPTVIAGSILTEYGSNFVEGKNDLFVIEGCEYRRHFLELHPDVLVITNIELDHTDYYSDLADMQDAFKSAIHLLPHDGLLVTNTTSKTIAPILHDIPHDTIPYQHIDVPPLQVAGEFNEENARAAKGAVFASFQDIKPFLIDASLAQFTGTWRRFEYKGKTKKGATVFDDYAHHPTAVKGTIASAKKSFPEHDIVVLFHPHLYSRTKSFFNEFRDALSTAHKAFVLPIYAAREKPDSSINSELLVEAIGKNGNSTYIPDFETAKQVLNEYDKDTVIITMGAGDVYKVADAIAK
jgi:UDP-N-acetylmuramate--alanine ligase